MGRGPAWRAIVSAVSAGGTGLSGDSLMTSPATSTPRPRMAASVVSVWLMVPR